MIYKPLDINILNNNFSNKIVGRNILYYDTLTSTMDKTKLFAKNDEGEGLVVIAENQTKGRGRFNRNWISPPGENISLSILLRPEIQQLSYINMAATLSISQVIKEYTNIKTSIKWPNDVKLNGKKISGILIESEVDSTELIYAVLGIGININFNPNDHSEISNIATSLYKETGKIVDRTSFLISFLKIFNSFYIKIKKHQSLTKQWASQLETIGKNIEINSSGNLVKGKAIKVTESGDLIIEFPNNTRKKITAGEVTLQST